MGTDHVSQQYRTPHGSLALDGEWNVERPGPQERILYGQQRIKGTASLHPELRAAASRLLGERRSSGGRPQAQLLEEPSVSHEQVYRGERCAASAVGGSGSAGREAGECGANRMGQSVCENVS